MENKIIDVLIKNNPNISKGEVRKLIAGNAIKVNGKVILNMEEIITSPSIIEVGKTKKFEYKEFTLEDYKQALTEYLGLNNLKGLSEPPFMENHKWTDEEGNNYSAWKIGEGVWTGDGGADLFQQKLKERCLEMLKEAKDDKS